MWDVAICSLFNCVYQAMADAHDSPARRAARSAVARSAARWGCRGDPLTWELGALQATVEERLRTSRSRDIGDAWWLAKELLNAARPEGKGRLRAWHALTARDPLSSSASHFAATGSSLVFSPTGADLQPNATLILAGCIEVADFCDFAGSGWVRDG